MTIVKRIALAWLVNAFSLTCGSAFDFPTDVLKAETIAISSMVTLPIYDSPEFRVLTFSPPLGKASDQRFTNPSQNCFVSVNSARVERNRHAKLSFA